ncbi:MAG: hypothetical protein ACOXZ0_07255 [Eubacteriales bacterium]
MNQNTNDAATKAAELLKSMDEKSLEQKKQIVDELKKLHENHPADIAVVESYAEALADLSWNQGNSGDIDSAKKTIEMLKALYNKYKNKGIAGYYAGALRTLSWNQGKNGDIDGAKVTIGTIITLYDKYKNQDIAISYILALVGLLWNQSDSGDTNGVKGTIITIKTLYDKYENETFANFYAWALVGLLWNQNDDGDINGAKETIKTLKVLYDKYENETFASFYADSLRNLSWRQGKNGNIDGAKKTIEMLKVLYDKYNKDILRFYARALVDLAQNQVNGGNIAETEETIEKIKFLYDECTDKELFKYITINQISDILAGIVFVDSDKIPENRIRLLDKTITIFKPKLRREASHTFNKTIEGYELGERKNLYIDLIQTYIYIAKIKNKLIVKNPPADESIGHYTKINRLNHLLKKNNSGRLRLSNASYMNDPSEGRALLEYLKAQA